MANFFAVIIGGDLGAYALARELNDAYGINPILVTAYNTLPIRDSSILHRHYFPQANDEKPLVAELMELGQKLKNKHPENPILLLANTDWRIQVLSENREELQKYFEITIPEKNTIDMVSNKKCFADLASQAGMRVPKSHYEDFSKSDQENWCPGTIPPDFSFPLVAKPADSSKYENLYFEGRKKVYRIDTQEELRQLWITLQKAGFRDTFIAQELIEGDDTQMYSVTAYVNSSGIASLLCCAHVLLEEHHPATLGNPCAMITKPIPELEIPVRKFLEITHYKGFANFDVKRSPHSGEYYFLEVNPRIGRNSFYCVGAGTNPMQVLVEDIIMCHPKSHYDVNRNCLYRVVPYSLLKRYILDTKLLSEVKRLENAKQMVDPLLNRNDYSLKRRWYRLLTGINHYRKFRKYYPQPTQTGF